MRVVYQLDTQRIPDYARFSLETCKRGWFNTRTVFFESNEEQRGTAMDCLDKMPGIQITSTVDGDLFEIKDKKAFFNKSFSEFRDLLEELYEVELENFTSGDMPDGSSLCDNLYFLRDVYMNGSEEYVCFNGLIIPLAEFIRDFHYNDKFYIGGVITYDYR